MLEQKQQVTRDKVSNLINWGHWFAFINGLLAVFAGSRYISTLGEPDSLIGWGYLSIYTLGQFSFLSFMVYLVFVFPLTLLLPYSRVLRGYAATISTVFLCIVLYDTVIFADYGLHLSPFAFDLAWGDLNSLLRGTSFIIAPVVILMLELTLANFLWKRINKIQKKNWGPKVLFVIGSCFVTSHFVHIWADAANVTEITRYDDAYPLSYPATARSFMERQGIERKINIEEPTHSKNDLTYPVAAMQCKTQEKPNILLIAISSLREDMVNTDTMPFLTHYAQTNLNFTQHISGGDNFSSSMFSLLYGLQTSYLSSDDFAFHSPIFTQELKKSGYQLAIFANSEKVNHTSPKGMFDDFTVKATPAHHNNAMADVAAINQLKQFSNEQRKPWFALLNLDATQTYDTPVGFLGIKTIKSPANYRPAQRVLFNQYRQSAYFIDRQLEQLISELNENTMVVITGLNGAVFSINVDYKAELSPDNIKVPLIIHWPKFGEKQIQYRTSHYGLVPTLMSQVLDCTNPTTDYSSGKTLLTPDVHDWTYVGDERIFAIYQQDEITMIDRHGKYRIYNADFTQRLKKKMSAPDVIQVMRESRRLYH
ncbi:MAG: DUF3413 domain-containing protein [Parashewanella sp.]